MITITYKTIRCYKQEGNVCECQTFTCFKGLIKISHTHCSIFPRYRKGGSGCATRVPGPQPAHRLGASEDHRRREVRVAQCSYSGVEGAFLALRAHTAMDQIREEYGLLYTVSELEALVADSALFCVRLLHFWLLDVLIYGTKEYILETY